MAFKPAGDSVPLFTKPSQFFKQQGVISVNEERLLVDLCAFSIYLRMLNAYNNGSHDMSGQLLLSIREISGLSDGAGIR